MAFVSSVSEKFQSLTIRSQGSQRSNVKANRFTSTRDFSLRDANTLCLSVCVNTNACTSQTSKNMKCNFRYNFLVIFLVLMAEMLHRAVRYISGRWWRKRQAALRHRSTSTRRNIPEGSHLYTAGKICLKIPKFSKAFWIYTWSTDRSWTHNWTGETQNGSKWILTGHEGPIGLKAYVLIEEEGGERGYREGKELRKKENKMVHLVKKFSALTEPQNTSLFSQNLAYSESHLFSQTLLHSF
jgi:hypothetical protein